MPSLHKSLILIRSPKSELVSFLRLLCLHLINYLSCRPSPLLASSELSEYTALGHHTNGIVIPLAADMAFFQTLLAAINDVSAHLVTVQSDVVNTLNALSQTIGDSTRPTSSTSSSFRPHSVLTSKPWSVKNPTKTKVGLLPAGSTSIMG